MSATRPDPDLAASQQAFARAIRDPDHSEPPPGISAERLTLYRELFFNNIRGIMGDAFPVLAGLVSSDDWEALMHAFYRDHPCATPLFPYLPREFLDWLDGGPTTAIDLPPFARELAHWEWAELEARLHPAELPEAPATEVDFLGRRPEVNPTLRLFLFRYPVHRIGPDFQPEEPEAEPVGLATYRRCDDSIDFMELNVVSVALLQALESSTGQTGEQVLEALADELDHPDPEALKAFGADFMADLARRQVLLGTGPMHQPTYQQ